jgi:hypothetical protein
MSSLSSLRWISALGAQSAGLGSWPLFMVVDLVGYPMIVQVIETALSPGVPKCLPSGFMARPRAGFAGNFSAAVPLSITVPRRAPP